MLFHCVIETLEVVREPEANFVLFAGDGVDLHEGFVQAEESFLLFRGCLF